MKVLARLSFLLITVLWGSLYAIIKEALGHMDPVVFTFFQALVLAPVALALIGIYRNELNSSTLKRGILLGSWLCLAILTVTVSLKFTQATNTAFFPSIGGVFGAIITGVFLKRLLGKSTWIAGGISLAGTLLILLTSTNGGTLRGNLIALLGALFVTTYTFLVDHDRRGHDPQQGEQTFWLIVGIEHLTLAFWMALIALLFGDWQHFHPVFAKDIAAIVYAAAAATFVPIALSIFMQKHIAPLEVAFISTLEPFWGVVFAFFYLGEKVSLPIYIGGALIITGTIIHTWSETGFAGILTAMSTARRLLTSRPEVQQVGEAGADQLPVALAVSTTAPEGRVTRRLTSPVAQRRQAHRVQKLGLSTSLYAFSKEKEVMPYLLMSMNGRSKQQ